MAEPTKKSAGIERFLVDQFGVNRSESIRQEKCVAAPIGCGGDAIEFRDALSRKEFTISGLCQACQDKIFGA